MGLIENLSTVGLAGRVSTHIARERFGPSRPLRRDEVPPAAERITPAWLTPHLCRDVPGAEVISVQVTGGDDGTSSRRSILVDYNAAGNDAGLPRRLFSKSAATLASRLLLGVTDISEGESTFYNQIRADLELRSPASYYAGFDPRTHRSLVILEDLSHRGWTFPNPLNNPVSKADAEDMIAEMAIYHAAFWNSPRFERDLKPLKQAHDWRHNLNRKVGFERRTLKGFDRAAHVIPERLVSRRDSLYPTLMTALVAHRSAPSTLLHQDLHPGNWLRDDSGRMGLYDWQCVATGHWALDVSYALGACLETEDRREWQESLIGLYVEQLRHYGVDAAPSFDEAWAGYREQPLHAFTMGLFTYGGSRFEPELQPKDYTLAAIGRLARHVDDLGTLEP